jgi:formate dehydrogenase accessory protein FdhE
MTDSWAGRIRRAEQLASSNDGSAALLAFYVKLLCVQEEIDNELRSRGSSPISGILERDLPILRPLLPGLLHLAAASGPDRLAGESRKLMNAGTAVVDEMLRRYWRAPSDQEFFAKALLQPYASRLADTGTAPIDRGLPQAANRCPFCAGAPQLSILHGDDMGSENPGRSLSCSLCLTRWPFRRVLCASCGEESETRLGYFHSIAYDHVRIEACDSCQHYLKGIDLSRLGVAVPLVDEIAAAALDVWAREHGYVKIELNLLGL